MIPRFHEADLPGARGGFTARAGGVSAEPYGAADGTGGLNLGRGVRDVPSAVTENRARVSAAIGAPVAWMRQVHGADVRLVTDRLAGDSGEIEVGECDGLVAPAGTRAALAALAADCVPVLLADPSGVVGVAHVGRGGLVRGTLSAVVEAMVELGAEPERTRAVVGPSICGRCYEVPAEMRDDVDATVPGTASTTSWGTPSLDLRSGVVSSLRAREVNAVERVEICTLEDERYYSHRRASRDGIPPRTGRFAGVVRSRVRHAG